MHNGRFDFAGKPPNAPSELSILDTTTRTLVRKINLGWNATKMSFSTDDLYLFCFTQGRSGKKKQEKEPASVTIIDALTNKVEATLSAGRLGKQILFTQDAPRIFVLSEGGKSEKKKGPPPLKPALTVFSLDSEEPLAVIEFVHSPAQMALSRNEKWLYILDRGAPSKKAKKHRNGTVHVVDVATLKLVTTHEVGTSPVRLSIDGKTDGVTVLAQVSAKDKQGKLYQFRGSELTSETDIGREPQFVRRFGDQPGMFVMTHEDMRFFPEDGSVSSSFVPLNPRKNKDASEDGGKRLVSCV